MRSQVDRERQGHECDDGRDGHRHDKGPESPHGVCSRRVGWSPIGHDGLTTRRYLDWSTSEEVAEAGHVQNVLDGVLGVDDPQGFACLVERQDGSETCAGQVDEPIQVQYDVPPPAFGDGVGLEV